MVDIPAFMPDDKFERAIQAHTPGTVINLTIGVASVRVAIPTDSQIIRIATTTDCYYLLGDVTVTVSANTGSYLPGGSVELPIDVKGHTYISVIRRTSDGNLNITKLT